MVTLKQNWVLIQKVHTFCLKRKTFILTYKGNGSEILFLFIIYKSMKKWDNNQRMSTYVTKILNAKPTIQNNSIK